MNNLPPALTSEQLKDLTARHLARYESMLRARLKGIAGIRPGECEALRQVWRDIEKQDGSIDSARYTPNEISEIQDAWFDEYGSLEETP
jgi:hypothetical protein